MSTAATLVLSTPSLAHTDHLLASNVSSAFQFITMMSRNRFAKLKKNKKTSPAYAYAQGIMWLKQAGP